MKNVFLTLILSASLAHSAFAQEAVKSLSPQEIADGWIWLYDGDPLLKSGIETPFNWGSIVEGVQNQKTIVKIRPIGLKSIFNGKDLTGWREFEGKKSKFSVDNGAIVVKDGPGDLQTEKKYENFVLQLECKSHGQHLNSGVFFRCRAGEYQNGYEMQIRNDFKAEPTQKYSVEEYDPQTHKLISKKVLMSTAVDYGTGAIYRRVPARKEVAKDGEWFTMTLVAQGNHFASWVNGIQQTDWIDNRPFSDNARTGFRQEAGHISFQGHDPTTHLSFRNIRIAELPATKK